MGYALVALVRNLVAGARVALFLPVDRLRFRADALQLLLLVVVSALVDVGADALRTGPDAQFSLAAIGSELAATALLLLGAAVLAAWSRERDALLALPVVVLASFVPAQLANVARDRWPFPIPGGEFSMDALRLVLMAWIVAILVRSARIAQSAAARFRTPRALVVAALLALPLFLPFGVLPSSGWWEEGVEESDASTSPASEPVLALQRQLQDDALSGLEDHAAGAVDLYFIGFAPDGTGTTWRERMSTAKRVMEGHWGASGRTIVYVNDVRSVTEAPIATVTHLREALSEVAGASDPDEDVLMLYVGGRSNRDGSLQVALPPLDLVQLSGAGLRSLLDEAGIRWRIIVLSVCTPGPFIEALADANTVVIANAGDGEVTECAGRGEPVSFGDAFFNEAMPRASSVTAAFDAAKIRVAPGASTDGSGPFLHVGSAISTKLDSVRGRSGGVMARAAGNR